MTMMDQTKGLSGKRRARINVSKFFAWWRERQRNKRDRQKLAQLPTDLLRDVGLEHLRDLKSDTADHFRLF
ncbi:DUF1127 domain-containing protein [Ruegeria sp. A3M17]|uniref:DUF1127 domain-containing protein n=1 Tax=Ruegeria sp. A3M17 TaxID=2267229 RepID=UPI000DEBBF2A|nr:DUF1127 domain-containing protein [Ruegeria sp. A3M17]RBW54992.1 hypothetical protein DS906_15860 [Ruegeria sp. A3M17]